MRHVNDTLKPATIDNAKPREKAHALTDGGGLQLEVLPSGSKTCSTTSHSPASPPSGGHAGKSLTRNRSASTSHRSEHRQTQMRCRAVT